MAKAQFQRNQKVWVQAVGAWATIEKIVPHWARGFDEPVRIAYDVGLGREFLANELQPEEAMEETTEVEGGWRIMRGRNKWQAPEDCAHHPFPGTFPVVVTDPKDWGGWRVPGAEYDRDPQRIERQARLITAAPRLMALARELLALVAESPEDAPPPMVGLADKAVRIHRFVNDIPASPAGAIPDADADAA